jgi:uncharacterized protein YgbK (DUF1537 family)
MGKLLILADDLTGALDTGVQFARAGHFTVVYLKTGEAGGSRRDVPSALNAGEAGDEAVLVLNTDSRHIHAAAAGDRILALETLIKETPYVYKKTDSTLRGHIGAELEALMKAADVPVLPFIPAYPDQGRVTREGRQFLRGVPIDQSDMAKDPLNPITKSSVADIIAVESAVTVRVVPVGQEPPVKQSDASPEREILVFDAAVNDEMDAIGASLKRAGLLRCTAGCAGFARTLMTLLPLPAKAAGGHTVPDQSAPMLVISGSLNPSSAEQVRCAREAAFPSLTLSSAKLTAGAWLASEEAAALLETARNHLKNDRICILSTSGDLSAEEANAAGGADTIARNLAAFAAELMQSYGPVKLFVSGGDTLLALMVFLGFDHIIPIRELESGVVLAYAGEKTEKQQLLVTKSGAFGNRETIINVAAALGVTPL